MRAIDDARTFVQDIVVPDLKALSARVDALEKSMRQSFEASDKIMLQRFELADARHEVLLIKMEAGFAAMDAKFAAADSRFDSVLKAINIDRRLEVLEAAQARLPAGEERHA